MKLGNNTDLERINAIDILLNEKADTTNKLGFNAIALTIIFTSLGGLIMLIGLLIWWREESKKLKAKI